MPESLQTFFNSSIYFSALLGGVSRPSVKAWIKILGTPAFWLNLSKNKDGSRVRMHSAGRNKPFDMQSGIIFFTFSKLEPEADFSPKYPPQSLYLFFPNLDKQFFRRRYSNAPLRCIAHLPFRQSDGLAGSLQFAMRKIIPKLVKVRSSGLGDGVVFLSSDKPQPSKIKNYFL